MPPLLPLLVVAVSSLAAILPRDSFHRMANRAAFVVEGVPLDDGRVRVERVHFGGNGSRLEREIRVPQLTRLSRVPFDFGDAPAQPIRPDRVLLFLADGSAADGYVPLHAFGSGARGVVWFVGDEVYEYQQPINPGGYELFRSGAVDASRTLATTPATVRAEIAAGLAARSRWEATLAIGDRRTRATAVVRWMSPRTSPDGERFAERMWPDFRTTIPSLGTDVVEPLAELVRSEPDSGSVGLAAFFLRELGKDARPAVPAVLARLAAPAGVEPILLVRVLRACGDPRAIPALRPLVADAEPHLAAEAGRALHAASDAEAAARIEARIPARLALGRGPEDLGFQGIVELLDALHDVDPSAALALARNRFRDAPALWGERAWLRAAAAADRPR